MKIIFNNEQRKHHAVTLRTIAVGIIIPVILNVLDIGNLDISYGMMIVLFMMAGVFEFLAYIMLKPFDDDHQPGENSNGN